MRDYEDQLIMKGKKDVKLHYEPKDKFFSIIILVSSNDNGKRYEYDGD
jgi:hypothetical protein